MDNETKTAIYWYGLADDGSQAYDYNSLCDLINSPVFNGKSLKEIWSLVTLYSVDGCAPAVRYKDYL